MVDQTPYPPDAMRWDAVREAFRLSPHQLEVFQLLYNGLPNGKIGEQRLDQLLLKVARARLSLSLSIVVGIVVSCTSASLLAQEPRGCEYGDWSPPGWIGDGAKVTRFGSVAELADRKLLFVGSDFHNFDTDTVRVTPWTALTPGGLDVPPPSARLHWYPRAVGMPDGGIAIVWGESIADSVVALANAPTRYARLKAAFFRDGVGWTEPLNLITSDEDLIVRTSRWEAKADSRGRLHVVARVGSSLVHAMVEDGVVRTQVVGSGGYFSPSLATRHDTVLIAAVGPTVADTTPLLLSASTDGGVTWNTRFLDVGLLGRIHSLTLMWEGKAPLLGWTQGLTPIGRLDVVRLIRLQPRERPWVEKPTLRLPPNVMHVGMVQDGCGAVHLVYTNLFSSVEAPRAMEYSRLQGTDWTPPARIEATGAPLEGMIAAFDGRVVVAWATELDGQQVRMQYSQLRHR